jgi:hypothetical protein
MTVVIASMSLLFISPTMTWGYTNTFQSTLASLSNQTLASNNTGALLHPLLHDRILRHLLVFPLSISRYEDVYNVK